MALIYADRVQETTTTTGTGNLTTAGAVSGFQSFSSACNSVSGLQAYICIVDSSGQWEVSLCTITISAGTVISRNAVQSSSNANALINVASGTSNLFMVQPADAVADKGASFAMAAHIIPM